MISALCAIGADDSAAFAALASAFSGRREDKLAFDVVFFAIYAGV